MNRQTLRAVKGSIKKWEAIVAGKGDDTGHHNCPLCKLYFGKEDCKGCPVMEKTGKKYCDKTPYQRWINAEDLNQDMEGWRARVGGPKSLRAAHAELRFLKALLP